MNILGIGTDIIEIDRIAKAIEKQKGFIARFFIQTEIEYFETKKNRAQTIAGCFAAKEAVVKAVGTGFDSSITPLDVVIGHYANGKPYATVSNMTDIKFLVSISHCNEYAMATAVAYRGE